MTHSSRVDRILARRARRNTRGTSRLGTFKGLGKGTATESKESIELNKRFVDRNNKENPTAKMFREFSESLKKKSARRQTLKKLNRAQDDNLVQKFFFVPKLKRFMVIDKPNVAGDAVPIRSETRPEEIKPLNIPKFSPLNFPRMFKRLGFLNSA